MRGDDRLQREPDSEGADEQLSTVALGYPCAGEGAR